MTLAEPVGLQTGWMGVKALPPAGACTSGPVVLEDLHTVGYPVEPTASSTAYQDVCDLNVCCSDCASLIYVYRSCTKLWNTLNNAPVPRLPTNLSSTPIKCEYPGPNSELLRYILLAL